MHTAPLSGGDPTLLRRLNVRAVLRVLRGSESLTLTQIGRAASLSRQTVDVAITELDREGWIEEVSPESGIGRPARRYRFRAEAGYVLGLDIGVGQARMILASLDGAVAATRRTELPQDLDAQGRHDLVRAAATGFLRDNAVPHSRLHGLCLGMPGIIDSTGRIRLSISIPEWTGFDLAHAASEWFGCPAHVENDANLATLAEHWRGAAQSTDECICILAGRRIGAGLLLGGRLHRGRSGAAGEIGTLDVINWEGNGVAALQDTHNEEQVFTDAAAGEAKAIELVDRFARSLAHGAAAMALTVNPDLVVIGGGYSWAGETLAAPLRRHLEALCLDPPQVAISMLGAEAPALGAVRLALDHADAELYGLQGPPRSNRANDA